MGLNFAEGFEQMFPADYLQSLQHLEKLQATTKAQLKALEAAVAALNAGKSFCAILAILSKTAFKSVAPVKQQHQFKVPTPK
jgi:hypothetical protein